jgi:membrane protease YdiL (CAAX protease family)
LNQSSGSATIFAILIILLAFAALGAFVRLALRMRAIGGGVKADGFILPDLLVACVMVAFFAMLAMEGLNHGANASTGPPSPEKIRDVLPSSCFILFIAFAIAAFLSYRGANLVDMLGFKRMPPLQAFGFAGLYLAAAVPLIMTASLVARHFIPDQSEEQIVVQLFRTEASRGDYSGVAIIALASVVMAPLAEEFLFRGFFYGVFKRYVGSAAAAIFCSALFAVFHANLASLAGLFVLALCLTLVYERTGSILAPIAMHALFNLASLVWLYSAARGWVS